MAADESKSHKMIDSIGYRPIGDSSDTSGIAKSNITTATVYDKVGLPVEIPFSINPGDYITDELMHSVGLYSKEEIKSARFSRFSRFGKVGDPYGRVNSGREYLFFVKPDLHICQVDGTDSFLYKLSGSSGDTRYQVGGVNIIGQSSSKTLTLNPQLNNHPYFADLLETHPNVVNELQYSLFGNQPIGHLLSFSVNGNLSLDSVSLSTMDIPATVYGTKYNYLQDSEASDEGNSFTLEFLDNKDLDTYHFFKAYTEYQNARKSGLVTPPTADYYRYRRLHNTMGIYKFIVGEDMETILYWAYLWGVIPLSCPRDAFQDASFSDGLSFSVNFEAAFVEDMNPMILYQFNNLMNQNLSLAGADTSTALKVFKRVDDNDNNLGYGHIDGRLPCGALVLRSKEAGTYSSDDRYKYRLKWFAAADDAINLDR